MAKRTTEYMLLSDIKPFDQNPKAHDEAKIRESIELYGFTNGMLLCERRKELAEGHGRLSVLEQMQGEGAPIPEGIEVSKDGKWLAPVQRGWSSKDDEAFKKYVVMANETVIKGGWAPEIVDYMEQFDDLGGTGFEPEDMSALKAALEGVDDSGPVRKPYTRAVNVPQYEPVGPVPDLRELVDYTKSDELKNRVEEAVKAGEIDEQVAAFLIHAADRHTVFNYRKAAEFYPYQSPAVKQLMEESALVIIDPDDAIKFGFAKLEERIEELGSADAEEA